MNFFSPFDSKKESKLFFLCKCLQIITQKISYSHLYIMHYQGYQITIFAQISQLRAILLQLQLKFSAELRNVCACFRNKQKFCTKMQNTQEHLHESFLLLEPYSKYSLLCGLCPISQQIYILRIMQCFGVLDKFRLKMSGYTVYCEFSI